MNEGIPFDLPIHAKLVHCEELVMAKVRVNILLRDREVLI